jgi:hypothetical protein
LNQIFDKTAGGEKFLADLQNRTSPDWFSGSREMFVLILVTFILAAILFIWAFYIHKRRKKSALRLSIPEPTVHFVRGSRNLGRKGQRRWKQRNPTLSETGGLPPRKPESVVPNSR